MRSSNIGICTVGIVDSGLNGSSESPKGNGCQGTMPGQGDSKRRHDVISLLDYHARGAMFFIECWIDA